MTFWTPPCRKLLIQVSSCHGGQNTSMAAISTNVQKAWIIHDKFQIMMTWVVASASIIYIQQVWWKIEYGLVKKNISFLLACLPFSIASECVYYGCKSSEFGSCTRQMWSWLEVVTQISSKLTEKKKKKHHKGEVNNPILEGFTVGGKNDILAQKNAFQCVKTQRDRRSRLHYMNAQQQPGPRNSAQTAYTDFDANSARW